MKILLIDDDPDLSSLLERFLTKQGHQVKLAAQGYAGLNLLSSFQPEAVLLDHNLPDVMGLELLPLFRDRAPETAVIMITGSGSTRDAVAAMKMGAENYLDKPFELDELATVLEALSEKRAKPAAKSPKDSARHDQFLTLPSAAMKDYYARLKEAAAQTQVNVLIEGETGTGKEHAARSIHELSPRAKGPFVELHCAALPENLIESELFGYESGAFTGADRSKAGLLEAAQQGTLFLDEVGELPLGTQAKLLKVLEEREMRRLGGLKTIRLDIRLVAATNRDLDAEVRLKRFRADLYYRLNVVKLKLPPLRERPEDIEALALHFFQRFCADFSKPLESLGAPVLAALKAHPWPGNVRELRNTMERAVLQAQNPGLEARDLDLGSQSPAAAPGAAHLDAERLRAVLEQERWNRSAAAARMGISRPTLLKWMKRHELL